MFRFSRELKYLLENFENAVKGHNLQGRIEMGACEGRQKENFRCGEKWAKIGRYESLNLFLNIILRYLDLRLENCPNSTMSLKMD